MSDSPLKIIHVESGRLWRGAQVQVLHSLLGQRARGHQSMLVCPGETALAKKAKEQGFEVFSYKMRFAFLLIDASRMACLFRKIKPNIVHLHSSHAHNVGGLASRLARVQKVILSRRMDTPITLWHHKLKYLFGYDHVISVSHGVKKRLVEAGVKPDKISVVRSTIENHWWDVPGDREGYRKQFGYHDDDIVVAVIAVVEHRKGQELLIRALPTILKQAPNVKVLLVGDDDLSTPERQLVKDAKLDDQVIFTGYREDIKGIMSAIDILASPSYLEGLGTSIMEAMACGKPVVGSDVGGIPESVVHNQTGYLVPVGDETALAEAIIKLATNPDLRQQLGEQGRQKAMKDFTVNQMVENTLKVYREVLSRSCSP